jgi:transposase-like protein
LTDLKARGVQDILIACIDNLNGFAEAIASIFPKVEVQSCIVHQIRNSLKYVASKDQKLFLKDLKKVYQAVNKSQAETELINLEEKWGHKYPVVIQSWNTNWEKLSNYFQYDERVRKLIYTTNPVEGFHRQVRKVTKTKGAFPNDMALLKLIYLATENIAKKWTQPLEKTIKVITP